MTVLTRKSRPFLMYDSPKEIHTKDCETRRPKSKAFADSTQHGLQGVEHYGYDLTCQCLPPAVRGGTQSKEVAD